MYRILLLLTSALLAAACSRLPYVASSDRAADGLRGPVRKLVQRDIDAFRTGKGPGDAWDEATVIEYDRAGNTLRRATYVASRTESIDEQRYRYDSLGRLEERDSYDRQRLVATTRYLYDTQGRLATEREFSLGGERRIRHRYDRRGYPRARCTEGGGCIRLRYGRGGRLKVRREGRLRTRYRYDGAERLREVELNDGSVDRYDTLGNIVLSRTRYTVRQEGRKPYTEYAELRAEYAFDAQGNWTSRTLSQPDETVSHSYRLIEYYPVEEETSR